MFASLRACACAWAIVLSCAAVSFAQDEAPASPSDLPATTPTPPIAFEQPPLSGSPSPMIRSFEVQPMQPRPAAIPATPSAPAASFADRQAYEQLLQRLDQLERQNAELRHAISTRLPPVDSDPNEIGYVRVNDANGTAIDDGQVRSIVETYLKEQDAQRKADEDAKRAAGYEVGSDLSMSATWKDGLEFSTKNKDFRVHVGGRTQFDVGWFSADPSLYTAAGAPTTGLGNVYGDGVDFRRARLRIDGSMYETIEWAAEYDLINSAALSGTSRALTAPTDLWWQFNEVPLLGHVRIGNQKEQIGFEHIVSSRFQPFMERSYNQDTFYGGLFNGFSPGIQAMNTYAADGEDEVGVWALGVFKPANNVFAFNTGNGDYSVVGRITRLLWYANEGKGLVHLGLSGKQATAVSTAVGAGSATPLRQQTYRTRDAIRAGLSANWPTPANIALFGDDMQEANAELVAVQDQWTFQAEYLVNGLQDARIAAGDPLGNTAFYHGGYIQLMKFLTNDHDHYSRKTGVFERVRPTENFFLVRDASGCRCFGTGAWQVGARYNYLDLRDGALSGGVLHNFTTGINWFLNPNMKIQFNYMATYRDAPLAGGVGDGWVSGWGFRVAHDF